MSNTEMFSGVFPQVWFCTKLEDIIGSIDTGFASGNHNVDKIGVPHLRPMNVSITGELDLSHTEYVESSGHKTLIAGDVLFNNTNSPKLVGKTAHISKNADWAFSNHMTRIRTYPEVIDSRYLGGDPIIISSLR